MLQINEYDDDDDACFVCLRNVQSTRCAIDRLTWRHSNLWSWYDLHAVGHDVVLWEVNWWRFVTLF